MVRVAVSLADSFELCYLPSNRALDWSENNIAALEKVLENLKQRARQEMSLRGLEMLATTTT